MLMTVLLAAATLATPKQLDKAGRACFAALRDYEAIEVAHVRAKDAWPTLEQRRAIAVKLAVAHETVRDSFQLGVDLAPGQDISPQALSLLRSEQQAIAALVTLTADAPLDVQQAMRAVARVFGTLFRLFPASGGEFDAHPPPRGLDGRGHAVRGRKAWVPLEKRTRMSVWCECVHPQPAWNGHTALAMEVCQRCGYRARRA